MQLGDYLQCPRGLEEFKYPEGYLDDNGDFIDDDRFWVRVLREDCQFDFAKR